TLDVHEGEILGILGPSGSGKSTLLRAIAGLELLTAGRVLWRGEDITMVPVHKRGFALMFQDGQLFPHRSVAENIAYPLTIAGSTKQSSAARVAELLSLVGLPSMGDRRVTALSGGEQQRVALARALAAQPRLLLLDEPLSSLDRELRDRLAGDLRRILRDTGTTAIMVTHDQDEAFAVSDRVAVMGQGRLLQTGSPSQVWRSPVTAEVARFLGYSTVLPPSAARRLVPGEETALALRPAALVVAPGGPWEATVLSVAPSVSGSRLRVELHGFNEIESVEAISNTPELFEIGSRVQLQVDPAGIAVLPVTEQ
ncbi:MAG TPA: ABC transporter ATP-binding protein, partial [Glaciihabitans sp.]|nr:ABC transporter ATP-binding protein [Glaciihabitans sp.]